jgi:hypothetical protein
MSSNNLSGQGLLMIVLGVWIILRSVTRDSTGRTLINHILGTNPTTQTDPLAALLATGTAAKVIGQRPNPSSGEDSSGEDASSGEGGGGIWGYLGDIGKKALGLGGSGSSPRTGGSGSSPGTPEPDLPVAP